jgi:N-acylglucosamine-6-phosphate 2-epimerase
VNVLERIGGLIVSVQAAEGSALDDPAVLAALARAAQDGGAAAVRIQGVRNLRAVRSRVTVPVIGLIKRRYGGFEPYITPTLREVAEVLDCGAEVVAFDATGRDRPDGSSLAEVVSAIRRGGALAMADCAQPEDGARALAAGADVLATTLCGYTKETRGAALPALDLVAEYAGLASFVICEGGVHRPEEAAAAVARGANAVVVGTAITNLQWVTERYARSVSDARALPKSSRG